MKISFILTFIFGVSCLWANDNLQIPSWLKVQRNGNLMLGNISCCLSVTDFKRGNNDIGKASNFLCPVSTIELDSKIWRSVLTPYGNCPEYQLTVDKKLSVLTPDTVSWTNSFTASAPGVIKGANITFSLPPEPFDLVVDGKKIHFGTQYDANVNFRGKCKKVTISAGSTEVEITGNDLMLATDDLRRYNPVFRIELVFAMNTPDPKLWSSAKLALDIRRQGIRLDRETFAKMNKKFTPISLTGVLNNTTTDDKADDGQCGWTDKGPEDCLYSYKLKGNTLLGGIPFELADPEKNHGKVLVGVSHPMRKLKLPVSVTIPMNGIQAGGLYFLHAGSWLGKDAPGGYTVTYSDGATVVIPLASNRNIYNWYTCSSNDVVAVGWKAPQGSAGLTLYPWTNPRPMTPIKAITLAVNGQHTPRSLEYAPMLLLFGITAVDTKPFIPEDEMVPRIDDSNWFAFDGTGNIEGGILDNSALNHTPAGKFGWVKVKGSELVFENDQDARFFGFTTVVTGQAYPHEQLSAFARRLHALGCNIIRFIGLVGPGKEEPGKQFYKKGSITELDPQRMDTFCYFLSELKKNGVYVQLDLRSGNVLGKELPEFEGVNWTHNAIFSPTVEKYQIDHAKRILNYINPYTGVTIGRDPVIAMVMVENEDSLLYEANLATVTNSAVLREIKSSFNQYLRQKYKSTPELRTAWNGALKDTENLELGTVDAPLDYKKQKYPEARNRDFRAYLAKVQGDHYRKVIKAVRETGCQAVSIGSNHWTNDMLDFWANAMNTEVFDRHSYWSHPVVDLGWDLHEISFSNAPSVGAADGGFLKSFVTRRIVGMPLAQTEWDISSTNEFRADGQLFVPAYAAMHGWTLFQFHFSLDTFQLKWNPKTRTNTLLPARDPLQMAMWPAIAAMFLRGDVRKADREYYETLTYDDILAGKKVDFDKIARAGLRGISGINFNPNYKIKSDPSLVPSNDAQVIPSVTNQLFWDISARQFRLVTPNTRAFSGFTNGKEVCCGDTVFQLKNDFAAVIITSRDYRKLDDAERILVTSVARCWNTGTRYNALHTRFAESGKAPILLQPVVGTISLMTGKKLAVYSLNFSGQRVKKLSSTYNGRTLTFPLGEAIHYELAVEE